MICLATDAQLRELFEDSLTQVLSEPKARAYVVNLLTEAVPGWNGLEAESVVLSFARARESGTFREHQVLGDLILWTGLVAPRSFEAHRSVYENIGRMCYHACYRILQRRWLLYEELADQLPSLIGGVDFSLQGK